MIRDHNAEATNPTCGGPHVSGGTDRSGSNQCQVSFWEGSEKFCVCVCGSSAKNFGSLIWGFVFVFRFIGLEAGCKEKKKESAKPTGLS